MTKYTDFVNYNLSMLTDQVRTDAFRQAIARTVRGNNVVVDLGTGSGVLAFFACQAGARRVYAIESEEVIEMARQICRNNGFQDRVVFRHDHSFRVELPEKADVIVTETLGTFGIDEGLVGSVIDARNRFLKANGTIIPQALELFVVPVEVPGFYTHMIDFWASGRYDIDFSPARRFAVNNFHPIKLDEGTFLGTPLRLARITLPDATTSEVHGDLAFDAKRRGRLFGFAGWFNAELVEDIVLSNAPSSVTSHWGMAFFPLERPVSVERGDPIRLTISATRNGTVWQWELRRDGQPLKQSTIWGFPQAPGELHKLSPGAAPTLSAKGRAELFILSLLNGEKTVGELQRELLERYPDLIHDSEQADAFVQEVVMKFT